MAANYSCDAVNRMEEARDSGRVDDSPLEKNGCYFKVIDIQVDGQEVHDRGGCYSMDGLDDFYKGIPPQPVNFIRVILDGRPQPDNDMDSLDELDSVDGLSYPRCSAFSRYSHFDPSRTCPLYSTEVTINPLDFYYLPTLRGLCGLQPRAGWYGIHSFAEHSSSCPNARKFNDVLRPTGEECSMYLTACRNLDGLISLVCCTPNAHISVKAFEKCASAGWRLLEDLGLSLNKVSSLRLTNGHEMQALQLLIIRVLTLSLENMMEYIRDHIQDDASQLRSNENIRFNADISTIDFDSGTAYALMLQTIEEETEYLIGAIEYTSKILLSAEGIQSTPVHAHLDEFRQCFDFYKLLIKHHKGRGGMIIEAFANKHSEKQANSVNQLTLLAAFFLPLSLAAGVLSMQTRFSDLNLLLYDFMGVVFILGTTAAFFYLTSRHGRSFLDRVLYWNYGYRTWDSVSLQKFLRVCLISIWWLAALASFLVGMFKGAIFGLKIFGYEAAGITVLWLLSLKLVRWAYDYQGNIKDLYDHRPSFLKFG